MKWSTSGEIRRSAPEFKVSCKNPSVERRRRDLSHPALYIEKRDIIVPHKKISTYIKNRKKEDDPYSTYYYIIILPWNEGGWNLNIQLYIWKKIFILSYNNNIRIKKRKEGDDPYNTYYYIIILPWKDGGWNLHIRLYI